MSCLKCEHLKNCLGDWWCDLMTLDDWMYPPFDVPNNCPKDK